MMDPALRHDFKDGVDRRVRHPARWLSLHMHDIQVCSIIAAARVHIEAVSLSTTVCDCDCALAGHENRIAKKRRKLLLPWLLVGTELRAGYRRWLLARLELLHSLLELLDAVEHLLFLSRLFPPGFD
jgi:hypothetical protein